VVTGEGFTHYTQDAAGKHFYLFITPEQAKAILDYFVTMVTEKDEGSPYNCTSSCVAAVRWGAGNNVKIFAKRRLMAGFFLARWHFCPPKARNALRTHLFRNTLYHNGLFPARNGL